MKEADRLQHIKEYYFSKKLAEIKRLQAQGKPVINLGIGNPDLSPPLSVIQKMQEIIQQKDIHGYQSYRGHPEFRQSIADFYKKYYAVELNPETQILPLTGSKEGILHISMAFLNPGDKVLIPNPGYMTYRSASLLAGGIIEEYNLTEKNHYQPDFEELESMDLSQIKIMWVNYPHMPGGAVADKSLFEKLVYFANKHNILIINDNPYSFILNNSPESILKYDENFTNILELNSLSKSHNMAGWRVGMLSGSEQHINAVLKFKSNMDSGMFLATQLAATEALKSKEIWFEQINQIYKKRKRLAEKIFDALEITYQKNQAGLFLWGKLPENIHSKDFTDQLLYNKNIFLSPGFIFGSNGNKYVRLSITNPEEVLKEVLKRIS